MCSINHILWENDRSTRTQKIGLWEEQIRKAYLFYLHLFRTGSDTSRSTADLQRWRFRMCLVSESRSTRLIYRADGGFMTFVKKYEIILFQRHQPSWKQLGYAANRWRSKWQSQLPWIIYFFVCKMFHEELNCGADNHKKPSRKAHFFCYPATFGYLSST